MVVEPWKEATNLLSGRRKAHRNGHIWQTSLNLPVRDWASFFESKRAVKEGDADIIHDGREFFLESCHVSASVKKRTPRTVPTVLSTKALSKLGQGDARRTLTSAQRAS